MDQVAGVTRVELRDGVERGQRALEFYTGDGLRFTVLPDRGMDLGAAEWRGIPLAWHSPVGFAGPWYHQPRGSGWLRTFGGGLLVTCGLSSVGPPSDDSGEHHGLHGRISHIPATEVNVTRAWQGDEYVLEAQGVVREARVFGENLLLRRRVRTRLGSAGIELADTVTNEGFSPTPLMILYHVNVGYPLVAEGSRLVASPSVRPEPRDTQARRGLDGFDRGGSPEPGFSEQVFRLHPSPTETASAAVAWINPTLGVGLCLRYRPDQLPYFWQWRMLGEGAYVVGLEPANCQVMGRRRERELQRVAILEPGSSVDFNLELSVLRTPAEIQSVGDPGTWAP